MLKFLAENIHIILATFSATLALLFLMGASAKSFGLLDHPDARKRHQNPTPMVGGLAMLIAILFIDFYFGLLDAEHEVVMLGVIGIVLIGLVDDFYNLKARNKLLNQFVAAIIVVLMGGLKVTHLGNLLGTDFISLPTYTQAFFTVIALVGLMNAINMLDGSDGLAAGLSMVSIIGFFLLAYLTKDSYHMQSALLFGSALLAFLLVNFRFNHNLPAKVYLGDAGCMLLGFILTTLAIHLTSDTMVPTSPIITVWIVALPLMDMARLIWIRSRAGSGITVGGRDHLHHLLLDLGYSVRTVALMLMCLQAVFVAIGLLGMVYAVPDYFMFYGFLGTLIAFHLGVASIGRRVKPHVHQGVEYS